MTNLILLSVLSLLHADPQPATTAPPAPAPAASPAAQPAAAHRTLRVTVRKCGVAFPMVPLVAEFGPGFRKLFAMTDAAGVATFDSLPNEPAICKLSIPAEWPAIAGTGPANWSPKTMKELTAPWTFEGRYVVPLSSANNESAFAIDLYPARTISLPVRIGGDPASAGVAFAGWRPPGADHDVMLKATTALGPTGMIELRCIPRSHPAFVYLGLERLPVGSPLTFVRVVVSAGETDALLDPAIFPLADGARGTVQVTLQAASTAPFRMFGSAETGMTFVSTDGSAIVSIPFVAERDANVTWPRSMPLPVGTWYFVPGAFTAGPVQSRLIERLRAGEDLSSTPVPKIVITEDATVAVNADAAAIERAIMGLPEPAPVVPAAPPAPLPRSVNATVRVTVRKNGEPFVGVPIGGGVSPTKYDSFAVTNELGVAVLSVPINDRPLCRVGIAGAGWPESAGPKPAALSSLPSSLQAFMAPWTFGEPICVPIMGSQPIVDVQMTVYPVRVVQMPVLVGNTPAKYGGAFIGWKPPESQYSCSIAGSPRIGSNGSLRIESAPLNAPSFAYIQTSQSRDRTNTQHFRAEIPAGPPGAQLSAFVVPDSPGPTGTLRVTLANRANSPFARFMSTASGIALVSADGSRVVSAVPVADVQGQPVWPLVVTVPVGTWYLAPSIFTGNNVQLRLIDRLRSGEALLATGIPRVVVGAGTNADVNADAGSLERAIMGIPEPIPPAPPAPPPANPGG